MRRLAPLAIALPVLLLLGACGNDSSGAADEPDDDETTTSAAPSASPSTELADFRDQVRTVSQDVGTMLADRVSTKLEFVTGKYASCTDDGEAFSYDANGRFAVPATPDEVAPALKRVLEGAGWTVKQRGESGGGDVRLVGEKDDLVTTVRVFGEAPIALYTVVSPCVEVPEEQRADLLAEHDEIIVEKQS